MQAARLGSTSFKFALKGDMKAVYPFNNDGPDAWPAAFHSLADIVRHPQLQKLLLNEMQTGFDSYTLWAYRPGAPDSPYCEGKPISAAELAAETAELAALTKALMALPVSKPTTFWIEMWENDWATRCGSYDPKVPPPASVLNAYTAWLRARQEGVTQGRAAFCTARNGILQKDSTDSVDCSHSRAIVDAAAVNVFNGAEVNLVGTCIHNASCGNIVRSVLPYVALDYVSYSSYDTMRTPQLADALDLIEAQHKRTPASPEWALFITEFGLPETSTDPKVVMQVVNNVLRIGWSKRLARVHYWQVINNERLGGGNCGTGAPVFDPAKQNGFWTTLPNGSLSLVGQYLKNIISGAQPMPPLQVATVAGRA